MAMTDYIAQMPMPAQSSRAGALDFKSGAQAGKSGFDLTTEDFMSLIMAQFQNQDIMNPASTDTFLNQMIQMMTIQTMTNMNDISTISYAASLVGKEVTLGVPGKDGLEEIVGVVTGTGLLNGQQVIFVDGEAYALNSIMAVGRIPEAEDPEDEIDPDFGIDPDNPPTEGEDPDKVPDGGTDPTPDAGGDSGSTPETGGGTDTPDPDAGEQPQA